MTMQPDHSDRRDEASTADLAAARPTPVTPASERVADATPDRPDVRAERWGADQERRPLLGDDELSGYRSRWETVQVRFVDDPRGTVKEADALVADLMQRLAQTFADERASLESQWEEGTDVSTEDLRVAMQRYRSFFARLLAA